eukprot:4585680-Pyramimonas_sp.AAC.1
MLDGEGWGGHWTGGRSGRAEVIREPVEVVVQTLLCLGTKVLGDSRLLLEQQVVGWGGQGKGKDT